MFIMKEIVWEHILDILNQSETFVFQMMEQDF